MFKDRLRQLRIERNLTQTDVAKALGVSTSTIANYEQGSREPRNSEMWKKIADFFNISLDDLMGRSFRSVSVPQNEHQACEKKKWHQQVKENTRIVYLGQDITPLVSLLNNDHTPITQEQQLAYISFYSNSHHAMFARKNLLEILNDIKEKTKEDISNSLNDIKKSIESDVIYWFDRCWENINVYKLYDNVKDLNTLYDQINTCLCMDRSAQKEFYLIPLEDDFTWLLEKLRQ